MHRARLLLATLAPVLREGTFRERVPATGGLVATEWHTRERGAAVFVENPTDQPLRGSVFPALPEVALAPGEVFVWVHDFPIGPAATYLSAYAGLVKSDAHLLHAAIRPDPHPGAVVLVHGTPGETRHVVLFFSGRGQEVPVTFSDSPRITLVDSCLVVAVSTEQAGEARIAPDGTLRFGSWEVSPEGVLHQWKRARVRIPAETSARLDPEPAALRVNGADARPGDFDLPGGESWIEALWPADGIPLAPLLIPDGACYLMELTDWE